MVQHRDPIPFRLRSLLNLIGLLLAVFAVSTALLALYSVLHHA